MIRRILGEPIYWAMKMPLLLSPRFLHFRCQQTELDSKLVRFHCKNTFWTYCKGLMSTHRSEKGCIWAQIRFLSLSRSKIQFTRRNCSLPLPFHLRGWAESCPRDNALWIHFSSFPRCLAQHSKFLEHWKVLPKYFESDTLGNSPQLFLHWEVLPIDHAIWFQKNHLVFAWTRGSLSDYSLFLLWSQHSIHFTGFNKLLPADLYFFLLQRGSDSSWVWVDCHWQLHFLWCILSLILGKFQFKPGKKLQSESNGIYSIGCGVVWDRVWRPYWMEPPVP